MVEQILRPLVEHPKRVWIVTILTCVIAVIFTWPTVDFYFAEAEERTRLLGELENGIELSQKLKLYEQQLDKKTVSLNVLEKKILSTKELEAFRNQLVDWVKSSGCKLRRIKIADPKIRLWYDEDDPFDSRARSDKEKKSPFRLQQTQLSVLVTGPMEKIVDFLGRVGEQDRTMHTGNFQLRKSTEDVSLVEMDLDLVLYDLLPAEKTQ